MIDIHPCRALPAIALALAGCNFNVSVGAPEAARAAGPGLQISWEKNMLSICHADLPGDCLQVWYLEAFCRSGSTNQGWDKTTIPHETELLEAPPGKKRLRLRSKVEGGVEVLHEIAAGADAVDFEVTAINRGPQYVDAVWVQPCMRVAGFTGRTQETYVEKCFIFVGGKLTPLPSTRRTTEALYRGGQVYVPEGIDRKDVNPRPISDDIPSNGLIGCVSKDGTRLLAMAWEPYQELFQGVIVCIHADFRLGGLQPGETRRARGKIYFLKNDPRELLERYGKDFPGSGK